MLNHGISSMCNSRVDRWDEHIDAVLFGIRVRTHHVTGYSPFYLMFGVLPRISGDVDNWNVELLLKVGRIES